MRKAPGEIQTVKVSFNGVFSTEPVPHKALLNRGDEVLNEGGKHHV
jgi:hypothetical protein